MPAFGLNTGGSPLPPSDPTPTPKRSFTTSAVLSAPRDVVLATSLASPGAVDLSWTAPEHNSGGSITGYKVYKCATQNGTFTLVASGITNLNYTATALGEGATWWFKVSAVNNNGEGTQSTAGSATTAIATNLNLGVVQTTNTQEYTLTGTLTRADNSAPLAGYNIKFTLTAGALVLGTVATDVNGNAVLVVTLDVATHEITASFDGSQS